MTDTKSPQTFASCPDCGWREPTSEASAKVKADEHNATCLRKRAHDQAFRR